MKRVLWMIGGAILGSVAFSVSFALIMSITPAGSMIERLMIDVLGTELAENVASITIAIAVVLGAVGGVIAGWLYTCPNRAGSRNRGSSTSEDVAGFPEESLGESITRIVEDKNEFYRSCLHPLEGREKVILTLLELYAFVHAVQSVWPGETMRERRQRFLDEVHSSTFALLRSKKLVDDPQSFEAMAQECYSRWGAALRKGEEGKLPSGFYWLAKEILLTIRPNEDPEIALIDSLEETFTHNTIAWIETLRSQRAPGLGSSRIIEGRLRGA